MLMMKDSPIFLDGYFCEECKEPVLKDDVENGWGCECFFISPDDFEYGTGEIPPFWIEYGLTQ